MKHHCARLLLLLSLVAAFATACACGGEEPPAPASSTDAKPMKEDKGEAAPDGDSKKAADKPADKEKKGTADKPKTLPPAEKKKVPDNWIEVTNRAKGYSFWVPDGSEEAATPVSRNGMDVYVATTPEPNNLDVFVVAFKDKSLSKDELLTEYAPTLLQAADEGFDGVKVNSGSKRDINEDYSIADATADYTGEDGNKIKVKARILVATDVTDNYIAVVLAEDKEFDASTETVDTILSTFAMWSGGSSGKSEE